MIFRRTVEVGLARAADGVDDAGLELHHADAVPAALRDEEQLVLAVHLAPEPFFIVEGDKIEAESVLQTRF